MIERLIYRALGTLIAIAGACTLIGGLTLLAIKIWVSIIGMLVH